MLCVRTMQASSWFTAWRARTAWRGIAVQMDRCQLLRPCAMQRNAAASTASFQPQRSVYCNPSPLTRRRTFLSMLQMPTLMRGADASGSLVPHNRRSRRFMALLPLLLLLMPLLLPRWVDC